MTSFTKEVNPRLAKRPLKINGRLANLELTSLVKEATDGYVMICVFQFGVLETTDMLPHLQDEKSTVVTLVIARDTRTTWGLRHDVNQEQTIKIIAMMTSSNGNIFHVTGPLCGEITGHRWILLTKPSNPELWCFSLIFAWTNGVSKQSRRRWFETPSCPLWRHCNSNPVQRKDAKAKLMYIQS